MLKIIVLCAFVQFSYALFGGGASSEKIVHLRKLGFDEDHQTMSHELVVPWVRPFKPGYCSSWEWHTDKRYREQRIAVCEELSGGMTTFNINSIQLHSISIQFNYIQ